MTPKELLKSLGDLDSDLIAEAEAYQAPKTHRWSRWLAVAACVAVAAAISWPLLTRSPETTPPQTVAANPGETIVDNPAEDVIPDDCAEPEETEIEPFESLGGLALGMTKQQVEAVLGDGYEATEPTQLSDNYKYFCWYYPEIYVRFVDRGTGWFVEELQAPKGSGLTLSTGISVDSTREEILAAYPDARVAEENGLWSARVRWADGGLWIFQDSEQGSFIRLAAVTWDSADILTTESVGGLTLGMSQQEVEAILGTGYKAEAVVELRKNFKVVNLCYPEAELQFADTGDGWFLNRIVLTLDSPLTLSTGIGTQSTEAEFLAAYPDARTVVEAGDPYSDGIAEQYLLVGSEDGGLRFYTDGILYGIWLGPLVPEPEPVANLLSAETIVVQCADGTEVTLVDKAAKKVSTILTITDPEVVSYPGESPKWWLDLGSGMYLAVYGHDDLATVYSGDHLDTTLETMTLELTGVFSDLDSTLESALENPSETWE